MPARTQASNTTSWWRTVPKSRIDVTPAQQAERRQEETGAQHLRKTELRARAHAALVVNRLERPNALREPVKEWQIICHAAHQHLTQVDVRHDQPRQDQPLLGVDHLHRMAGTNLADTADATMLHEDVRTQHAVCGVARHNRCPTEQKSVGIALLVARRLVLSACVRAKRAPH